MLQEIAIQIRWNTKQLTKEFYKQNLVIRHVTRPCLCMTTSIIIKITRVISMWTPHWITVSCHGVEGPMTTGYYCAIFPFCGGKIKDDKKNKGILWLGYHRYPSNENQINMLITVSEFVLGQTWTTSQDHLIQASKTFPFVQCSLNYLRNSQTIYFPLQPIITQNPPCKTLETIQIPTSKDPSQELDTRMLTMKLTATKPLLRYNLTNRKHYNPTNLTTLLNSEQCS